MEEKTTRCCVKFSGKGQMCNSIRLQAARGIVEILLEEKRSIFLKERGKNELVKCKRGNYP